MEEGMETAKWLLGMFLLGAAIYDFRRRLVYLPALALAAAVGCIFLIKDAPGGIELMLRMLPGILMLLMSFATGGQVGAGDGLVLLLMGMYLPFDRVAASLLWGLLLSFLVAAAMFMARKQPTGKLNHRLPFVPCLFGGYLIQLAMWAS